MTKTSSIKQINTKELGELIERVEHAILHDLALSTEDMKLLLSAIMTLCSLQQKMAQDDVTLHKLRKLLGMVKQSEQRRNNSDASRKKTNPDNKHENKRKKTRKPKKPAPVVVHKIEEYQRGQQCPECKIGKLYKHDPGSLLRITGHAPYEVIRHITEQLRCNGCQKVYKAPLPAEVLDDGDADQRYGYSARTLMVISKFYSGLPYYHQSNLADTFGHSVTASTIYDQCEYVANDVMPIFYELHRQGADAPRFLLDDTHNLILGQEPELRDRRNGKGKQLRTGVYSSGMIALLESGHEIVLFETSLGHAGEHLDKILSKRSEGLPMPLTMSDALSSNKPTVMDVYRSLCNAHCRRQFVDLENHHPKDVEWVLETYSIIWDNEYKVKEKNLNSNERLAYHKEHSLPAMEKLKYWAEEKKKAPTFEENSPLGKAINYLLKHYNNLIMFCMMASALIDNNRMEETLKIIIRSRKTSHFYKTVIGAQVANVLLSVIATAHRADTNIFEYLLALQKNRTAVRENPSAWLPWCYENQLNLKVASNEEKVCQV